MATVEWWYSYVLVRVRCVMVVTFEGAGLRFRYPENWQLQREDTEEGWSVLVQSPDTAFVLISVREDMPTAYGMAATALEAMREEYPDLEAEECVEELAGQPAVGHDIRFYSLDLTNTAWTRTFYGERGTFLVLC